MAALIVLAVIALFVLVMLAKTVRVIPQARAGVVERLGRYSRTLTPGLTIVIPFIDRVRPLLDLREQTVSVEPQAAILAAEGQSKAIETVFAAIHAGDPDPSLLAYQYLQVLPQIAQGDANKVWVIPSELTQALGRISERVIAPAKPGSDTT